jgi:prepilin-type N-terminal cleavage/methylation domain-containing protein
VCRIRRAFTLIELLVVIAIIGMLAAMITVVAIRARIVAMNARIKLEVSQLDLALNAYKAEFGAYPPDGTNQAAIQQHLATAFPNYTGGLPNGVNLNPSTALLFWLGGMTDANGNYNGFSKNPQNPFDTNASRYPAFYSFDRSRITPSATVGNGQYFPDNSLGTGTNNSPFVYFAAQNNTYGSTYACTSGTTSVTVKPYVDTRLANAPPVNPLTFQILCCGLDGIFGAGNCYPSGVATGTGTAYNAANYDDITNFTTKAKLEDDVPQ